MMSRRLSVLLAAGCAMLLTACGGEGTPTGGNPPSARTGSLTVSFAGLPNGASGSVTVTGPSAYSRTVTSAETITGLPEGQYTVAALEATSGQDRFAPAPASQTIAVTRGATATAAVTYSVASGSIALTIEGLPSGSTAAVTVTGPNSFTRAVTTSSTLGGLAPGDYTISAAAVQANGHGYAPATAERRVRIEPSLTAIPAAMTYEIATGAITAVIAGLPGGMSPTATLTGPGSFSRSVSSGETLTNLAPGTYTITATPVSVGPDQYRVDTPVQIQLTPSETPKMATVQYALASGRLSITISGLPSGTSGNVRVTGPGNYSRAVTINETLQGLAPGRYRITPNDVTTGGVTYGVASGASDVDVTASPAPLSVALTYSITRGSLALVINGLPQSIPAAVTVTGPDNFTTTVATTSTLNALKPGSYTVAAANVTAGVHIYATTSGSQTVTIGASATPAQALISYGLASGLVSLTVNGLPANVFASITVTGPGGYSRPVSGSTLLTGLTPGAYTVAAQLAQSGNAFWSPNPASQVINVAPSTSALQATITYQTANGGLNVNITGLPSGANAAVTITGPNNFSTTLTGSQTLSGLLSGGYTVTAAAVTAGGSTYTVTPATQTAVVGGGVTSSINVAYAQSAGPPPPPVPLNLLIEGMHVQQTVQNSAGTVPLVAGRDGLLRVFVKATASNAASPTVRVRLYAGTTLQSTLTINAPASSVPTSPNQGLLSGTWNVVIPGSLMQPGLKVLADVDPGNAVTESSEGDNSFPTSGSALAMDVRAIPAFDIRFVPVTQTVNGTTGNVTSINMAQYLTMATKVFPLGTVNADVRAPFSTSAPVLQDEDGNNAWGQILSEINALRTADGSTKYYAGIVKVGYFSGIAGLGYVPGRATLNWDDLPSASEVLAHELGHNFGRFHAPCGGAGGPDPNFPYAGGTIGVYGYDQGANSLKAPSLTDLMGYCSDNWVSDYTYTAVFNHRIANPVVAAARVLASSTPRPGLLIWGRVQNGQVILEPAFEVTAAPSLPTRPGKHRLEALGALGETLLSLSFDGESVADSKDPTAQHFAFVVPMERMKNTMPTRLRVVGPRSTVERRSQGALEAAVAGEAQQEGPRRLRVKWADRDVQGALVRDARTGEILTFVRGASEVALTTAATELDVTWSDGVRSTRSRVRVGRPELR